MTLDPEIRITPHPHRWTRHELGMDGKVVSQLSVPELRMRVGSAVVRLGENGGAGPGRDGRVAGVFCDATGTVVAYAGRDAREERVRVFEAGAAAPGHYADIVRWAAERAVELRLERVTFLCPAEHALADHLTWYGARVEADFPRCGSGLGRMVDLPRFRVATLPAGPR